MLKSTVLTASNEDKNHKANDFLCYKLLWLSVCWWHPLRWRTRSGHNTWMVNRYLWYSIFTGLVQRIFNCDKIQDTILHIDNVLNIFSYESRFSVIKYKSQTVNKNSAIVIAMSAVKNGDTASMLPFKANFENIAIIHTVSKTGLFDRK